MPDDKIPAGKEYGPIEVPASEETAAINIDPSEFIPFPHLAKEDWALYQELRASGASFKLMPEDDGYFHIER